ncbi:MAG TPA: RNA methyltransferase [Actinobacteria bacterium]|nr:RNA methyltransferase [Actinomycetota bacterium]
MREIRSPANPAVKAAAELHRRRRRRERGRTLVEGPGPLGEALDAGIVPETVFTRAVDEVVAAAEAAGAETVVVDDRILRRIAGTTHPRGPVAVVEIPSPAPARRHPTLVLHEVADPGNAGTLVRSAAAFGYDVAVIGGVDPWEPKTIRAGAGAHFRVRFVVPADLDELRRVGLVVAGAVPRGGVPPEELDPEAAIVVGSEAHGLPGDVDLDVAVTIPTAIESLNAAVAGSILMYVAARRAGRLGQGG